YRSSIDFADQREEDLRIVLRIDAPELAALPWEAMYDEQSGYVCRQRQLVRHVPVASAPRPLTVQAPLQILGVISAPRDWSPLEADRERDQLTRALAEPIRNGLVKLTWAPSATWAGIHEQLMAGSWHVIHFIGHGAFDLVRDEGRLVLVGEDGLADPKEASLVADLLRQARPMPRLVVLNSCQGATGSTGDLFSGTAAALARSGVTALAAMQFAISNAAAIAFARGFYTALARGRAVDQAVSAGRVAILGTSGETLEWLTPALYLRGHESNLFMVEQAVSRPQAERRSHAPADTALGWDAPSATAANARPRHDRLISADEQSRLVLTDHSAPVRTVLYSPDSELLASASIDGTVLLWASD
ncbi:MAG: CHAT domain-containing protein, partial [Solirubrobacteraceae bacterium]